MRLQQYLGAPDGQPGDKCDQRSRPRMLHVSALQSAPYGTDGPLIVIEAKCEAFARGNGHEIKRSPHVPGVVQHSPAITDIESSKGAKIAFVKRKSPLNGPMGGGRKTTFHFAAAFHALAIVVKRVNGCGAETKGSERLNAAAAADIEKGFPADVAEQGVQALLGASYSRFVNAGKKLLPVLTELKDQCS